ncbi:MCP four helix bundle domain-containing protein, partial [Desulforegula conservatrix]|uniref:MCP four helix bundle domain-containing protein n=1 Tax=Desulforegula conservatrix TaxID=153026 RepID=UPI000485AF33
MKWFKNLKIAKKLTAGFLMVCSIAMIIGVVGFIGAVELNHKIDEISRIRMPSMKALGMMEQAQTAVKAAERTLLYLDLDKDRIQREYKHIKDEFGKAEKGWLIYEPLPHTPEEIQILKQFTPAWAEWKKGMETFVSISEQYRESKDPKLYEQMSEQVLKKNSIAFRSVEELFGKIIEINNKTTEDMDVAANNMGKSVKTWIIITMGIGLIAALFTAIGIAKSITAPVLACMKAAEKIASGDTDIEFDTTANDEPGMLQKAMSKMVTAIQKVIEDATTLSKAAVEGKLATRADATKHQGDFRRIIEGVNSTLDAVIGPLNVSAEYVDRISKGDIPPKITDNYNGDFKEIKNNINVLIDANNEITSVAEAIANGDLTIDIQKRSNQDKLMIALDTMLNRLTEII